MCGRQESRMTWMFWVWTTRKTKNLLMTGEGCGGSRLGGKVYANFQMHIRHPNRDVKWEVEYMSLEFRQWIWAGNRNLEVVSIDVSFRGSTWQCSLAGGLDQGFCGEDERTRGLTQSTWFKVWCTADAHEILVPFLPTTDHTTRSMRSFRPSIYLSIVTSHIC